MGLDYSPHIVNESARFYEVLCASDPDASVPTCDGWTAADLLWHLAEVQHFWAAIVGDRLTDPSGYTPPARPDRWSDVQALFLTANDMLLRNLDAAADEVAVWTWFESQRNVGFVRRRQAHEALIHRLDAELTVGSRTPLSPALASDGVLEVIECILGGLPSWATRTAEGPVGQLRSTDTEGTWSVRVDQWSGTSPDSGADYTGESVLERVADAPPDFEITGTAADLDAWLWNRPTVGKVEVRGDADSLLAMVAAGVS